jgi:triphosphatase
MAESRSASRDDASAEIELKLELDAPDLGRLREALRRCAGAKGKRQKLETVYYDTPRQVLKDAGVSLRVRRIGKRRIQTIKAGNGAAAGLFSRAEWEREIDGEEPDLAAALGTALEPFVAEGKAKRIKPLFALKVERDLFRIRDGGSAFEATVDEGVVEAKERMEPLCELELELKRGAAPDLFRFAKVLAEIVPLRLGIRTKAERGYALVDAKPPKAAKARPLALKPGLTTAAAFQAVGRACLHHLMENEAVLRRLGRDPDAVHQMRVAMRRLRAAISLFRDVTADAGRESVKTELKWIANALGAARDLDVFLGKTLGPLRDANPGAADLSELAAAIEARRDKAYDKALEAVASPRFRALVLDTAAWIETGAWLGTGHPALRDRPVEAFAAKELSRRAKKVSRRGAGLEHLDPEARHRVRIEIKKLRYAAEFFASLFDGKAKTKRRKSFLSALERLQDVLGDLNDIAVSGEIVSGEAGIRVVEAQTSRFDERLRAAVSAYRDFSETEPFWR